MSPIDIVRMANEVEARLTAHGAALRAQLASAPPPPGMKALTDDQFAEAVLKMAGPDGVYPPMPLVFPVLDRDGLPILDHLGQPLTQTRVMSPWLAQFALRKLPPSPHAGEPLVDGGDAILVRWERINARQGAVNG